MPITALIRKKKKYKLLDRDHKKKQAANCGQYYKNNPGPNGNNKNY